MAKTARRLADPSMPRLLDAFWRAAAYCVHPKVIGFSLLPLLILVALALGLGYFFWDSALAAVRAWLEATAWAPRLWAWFDNLGLSSLKSALVPLIVVFAVTPLMVMLALLLVAALATPAVVSLVAARRFPLLERKRGAPWWHSVGWSLGHTAVALVALGLSLPLWFVPPLILIVPPLIWGWLTYRVMAFDVLAEHASREERQQLFRRHRWWLLAIGVVTGLMGAAPSVVWASGVVFAALFVLLVPVAIWIYTLVLAFSALWFSHYALAALQALREENDALPRSTLIDAPTTTPTAPEVLPP